MGKSNLEMGVFKKLSSVFYWKASQTFHMLGIVTIQEDDVIWENPNLAV